MIDEKKVTLLTGHFGSGKTELAINLALDAIKVKSKVALVDLDVINPYYRTRDVHEMLERHNIELIAPQGDLRSADLPIVSGEIYRVLHDPSYHLIVDAGGDKDGAVALGQYYNEWKDMNLDVLFVLNANRPYVSTLQGVIQTIKEIESASRLKVTGLINNTNVISQTTLEDIHKGLELSLNASKSLDIPLLYTSVSKQLSKKAEQFSQQHAVRIIERFMKLPWEELV